MRLANASPGGVAQGRGALSRANDVREKDSRKDAIRSLLFFDGPLLSKKHGALFPLWILKYLPNMVAAHISMAYNAQGPNSTITTACVAGTQAIGEAFRLVSRGDAVLNASTTIAQAETVLDHPALNDSCL